MKKIKISQQEARKITELYHLGNFQRLGVVKGGAVNYNFKLKTDSGDYIVRVIGRKGENIGRRLELEFRVLEYLKQRKFSYDVPYPLKNDYGEYISRLDGKRLWIYKRLDGENPKKMNDSKIHELARATAEYHRIMKGFPIKMKTIEASQLPENEKSDVNILKRRYAQMRNIKPKNKVDKLMLTNIKLFENELERVKDLSFSENFLLTHQDIHRTNILFKGNKLTGILDFEGITFAPRINDLTYITKSLFFKKDRILDKRLFNLFLREYEKINPLSKSEKEAILPYLTRYNCNMFEYFYTHCFEGKVPDVGCLKWTINTAKGLADELGVET